MVVDRETREPKGTINHNDIRLYRTNKNAKSARRALIFMPTEEEKLRLQQSYGIMSIDTVTGAVKIEEE
jgi:hypothetical protein